MSVMDPGQAGATTRATTTEHGVRGQVTDTFPRRTLRHVETKPSFLTTEFWAMVAGVVGLIVLYNVTDDPSLDLWRTTGLMTGIASAYIISRGLAKSGSQRHRRTDEDAA